MYVRYDCADKGRLLKRLICWMRGYHEMTEPVTIGSVQKCRTCGATRVWKPT